MSVGDFALFGRLHPLILHLPIGLLLGALVLEVLAARGKLARAALVPYLWLAALSAVLTAAAGWVLSHEEGYGGETVEQHERLGIAVASAAVLAALLHAAHGRSRLRLDLYRAALVAACVLLIPAGHLGSTLTHGEDWLEGPRAPRPRALATQLDGALPEGPGEEPGAELVEAPAPAPAAPDTYALEIAPLLEARCTSCHGAKKQKGELRLDSPAGLLAGGESGPALVPGDPAASRFLVRAKLPLEHEDHMPPEGKPQPTAEELAALEAWVAAGAPFGSTAPSGQGAESTESTDRADGAEPESAAAPTPAAAPADPGPPAAALAALAEAFVHHERVEPDTELLLVDVAPVAASFGDAELARLVPLAPWIAELSLARSAITDAALAELARFPVLRRLDLRATGVGDAGLAALAGHGTLAELELAQTRLSDSAVETLLALPGLRRVGLWNAGLSAGALARLRAVPGLAVVAGDEPLAEVLESEGELTFTSDRPLPGAELVPEALRPVNTTCPVSGSPVNPKYALVHTGAAGTRVVAFCCPNCPKEFWADPAKFEPKLP